MFTQEEINNIINLKDSNGVQLDIFSLGEILYLDDGDINKGNCRYSSHSLFIDIDDFNECNTEEEVLNQWHWSLKDIVIERLL